MVWVGVDEALVEAGGEQSLHVNTSVFLRERKISMLASASAMRFNVGSVSKCVLNALIAWLKAAKILALGGIWLQRYVCMQAVAKDSANVFFFSSY
jgi:hypothetical protein